MLRALLTRLRWPLLGGVAALLLTTTSALAGSGVGATLDLGLANSVNAQTTLSGNPGANFLFRFTGTGTAATLRVDAGTGAAINGVSTSGTGQIGQSSTGIGLQGTHTGSTGTSAGVEGRTSSSDAGAVGVFGKVTAATPGADSAGVRGTSSATSGYGVLGDNTASGSNSVGVFGKSSGRAGILGEGTKTGASLLSSGTGVYACSATNAAPFPCAPGPFITNVGVGAQFRSMDANGIGLLACAGSCGAATGVPYGAQFEAFGSGAIGVKVTATTPVSGSHTVGIDADAAGSGAIGGRFRSSGLDSGSVGLSGLYVGGDVNGTGVFGQTNATGPGEAGVSGEATGTDGIGVKGVANSGANAVGVLGSSTSGLAGRFDGDVRVTGKLTKEYAVNTPSRAIPIAYGVVNSSGTLTSGTANVSASFDSVNKRYLITITGESYTNPAYTTVVTPSASASTPLLPTTSAVSGQLLVKVWNLTGTAVQSAFSFVTFKS